MINHSSLILSIEWFFFFLLWNVCSSQQNLDDPFDPRALEADIQVAAATQKALAWEKALSAASGRTLSLMLDAPQDPSAKKSSDEI